MRLLQHAGAGASVSHDCVLTTTVECSLANLFPTCDFVIVDLVILDPVSGRVKQKNPRRAPFCVLRSGKFIPKTIFT